MRDAIVNEVHQQFKVIGPLKFELKPGGHYYLNEDNYTENRIVKLSLVAHFCELMAASHSVCGENNLVMSMDIEDIASRLFNLYEPFFTAGVNIFEYTEYFLPKTLEKYLKRPVVSGQMNASDDESTEGLPTGWWYDFPGFAHKVFTYGKIVISHDMYPHVCSYAPNDNDNENVMVGIEITKPEDYGKLFVEWPDAAAEIAMAIKFVVNDYADCDK
jgi:hypothetical protein